MRVTLASTAAWATDARPQRARGAGASALRRNGPIVGEVCNPTAAAAGVAIPKRYNRRTGELSDREKGSPNATMLPWRTAVAPNAMAKKRRISDATRSGSIWSTVLIRPLANVGAGLTSSCPCHDLPRKRLVLHLSQVHPRRSRTAPIRSKPRTLMAEIACCLSLRTRELQPRIPACPHAARALSRSSSTTASNRST